MVKNVSTRNIPQCFGCDRCDETVQNGLCNQCYDGMEHGMWVTVTSGTVYDLTDRHAVWQTSSSK